MNATIQVGKIQPEDDVGASSSFYRKVIFLVGLANLVTSSDLSITNVALKSIGEGLKVPPDKLSWVLSASALTFASFLILGGRASDIYGQRKCFLIGVSLFSLGSILSGFAINIDMLICTRALQGLGSAFFVPASFSLINTLLPDGAVRRRALRTYGTMQGLSFIMGMLVGGAVATSFGWRVCFFVNVPLAGGALLLAWQVIPRMDPKRTRQSLDYVGAFLICSAITLLILAFSAIGARGFTSLRGLGQLGGGMALLILFFVHEGRASQPMVPLSVFRVHNVIGANLAMLTVCAGTVGMFILAGVYLQMVLGLSAVMTGVAMVPYGSAIMLGSQASHWAMNRWPLRVNIIAGNTVILLGLLLLAATVKFAPGYWLGMLPGMCIVGGASIIATVGMMASGTAAVSPPQQGIASGLIMTSVQIGIALGASLILTVFGMTSAGGMSLPVSFSVSFASAAAAVAVSIVIGVALIRERQE
jgi:MFS family permease